MYKSNWCSEQISRIERRFCRKGRRHFQMWQSRPPLLRSYERSTRALMQSKDLSSRVLTDLVLRISYLGDEHARAISYVKIILHIRSLVPKISLYTRHADDNDA